MNARWSSGIVAATLAAVPLGCGPVEVEVDELGSARQSLHAWSTYHWARPSNPFSLETVDSLTAGWDAYLATTVVDWSASAVVDLTAIAGDETSISRKRCVPTSGKVRVCNLAYGRNRWLGLAQVWLNSAGHITQGAVKLNDSYFTLATYNTPAWKNLVMCQEVGHTLGLDHQDENSSNANLGSCMDYTNTPQGPPSNEHPNQHDYDQLELIYGHADSSTTAATSPASSSQEPGENLGQLLRRAERLEHWIRLLPEGGQLHSFVTLAE